MTREEQIHKIANTISTNIGKEIDEDYICNDEYDFTIGFESGAIWADKTMIDKACEWLLTHIDKDLVIYHEQSWKSLEQLVKEFKKAMEE